MDVRRQRAILQRIAHLAMRACGLLPDFSSEARAEFYRIPDPPAAEIFPMFPEKLSTDLASLGYREIRPAFVIGPQDPRAACSRRRGAGIHRLQEGRLR